MHDIKYFFLNKKNQTMQGGKKNSGGKITESIIKKYYFLKFRGAAALPEPIWIRPCIEASIIL
jgi:hypothetical protein